MTDEELINSLKRLKMQTGSLACLGCGREHNCGIHGCAILQETIAFVEKKLAEGNPRGVMEYRDGRLYQKTVRCPVCGGITPQGCPRCCGAGQVAAPDTKGDLLRRMTDRELAEELFNFRFDGYAKAQGAETVLPASIREIEKWLEETTE